MNDTPSDLDVIAKAAKAASKSFENFKVAGVKQASAAAKAVEDMVKAVQQMDDALAKMPTFNVATRLSKVAGQLGLGTTGIYTVQSKEVVINLNLKVTMETGKMESILVENKNSIIRDRINYLLNKGADDKGNGLAKISDTEGASAGPNFGNKVVTTNKEE